VNPTEFDDALSYLKADCWTVWQRYDQAKRSRFSTYVYRILSRRVASWYRQRFTDTRYRERPTLVSLYDNDLDRQRPQRRVVGRVRPDQRRRAEPGRTEDPHQVRPAE
jgi:hypothetical protein